MGLLDGKSRTVAIAVTFHTSGVVTFVLGIGQHLGLGGSQSCIVAGPLDKADRPTVLVR